jgi:predicted RNase H-like HicB family nuclease
VLLAWRLLASRAGLKTGHYKELPGCAADGKTCKEAIANVEIIIHEWIETAKELGRLAFA